MEEQKFDLWCMVELFGHQKIAGRCTEQNVAGTNMLRIDVPETPNQPGYTRFLSSGAIYAINPVAEEVARKLADNYNTAPIDVWSAKRLFEDEIKALQSGRNNGEDLGF